MKKTFQLSHPKKKFARLVDSVRCDVKKYLKRERKKELPEGVDYWDFDCKVGASAELAEVIDVAEIGKSINEAESQQFEAIYVELLAKPGHRAERPSIDPEDSSR